MQLRENIYRIIEPRNANKYSRAYDFVMLIAIAIGILPLMFRHQIKLFWYFDLISGICFIVDYLLRWVTADMDSRRNKWAAFAIYPFTPMAIIDLLSILPVFNLLSPENRARYYAQFYHWLFSTYSSRHSSCLMQKKTSTLRLANISLIVSSMHSIGLPVR